jgi:hypothetical protein
LSIRFVWGMLTGISANCGSQQGQHQLFQMHLSATHTSEYHKF